MPWSRAPIAVCWPSRSPPQAAWRAPITEIEPPAERAPRVSVVIPTFNRRDGVGRAIESVLEQTLEDFELLVVDDGSRDGTAGFLRGRYGHDARVRVLEKANGGCGSARNLGVARARAPLVAYLDSDDRARPERLARQAAALDAHPEADLCICNAQLEDAAGRPVVTMFEHKGFVAPTSLESMFQAAWAAPSTWMLRTRTARALPFDVATRYQEDVEFLYRLQWAGHGVVLLDDVLVHYQVEDPADGEVRMSENRREMDAHWSRIHAANWERLTPEQRARIRRPYHVHRRFAKHYVGAGDWAAAEPHCRRWWLARPLRPRPLWLWLTCLARKRLDASDRLP